MQQTAERTMPRGLGQNRLRWEPGRQSGFAAGHEFTFGRVSEVWKISRPGSSFPAEAGESPGVTCPAGRMSCPASLRCLMSRMKHP